MWTEWNPSVMRNQPFDKESRYDFPNAWNYRKSNSCSVKHIHARYAMTPVDTDGSFWQISPFTKTIHVDVPSRVKPIKVTTNLSVWEEFDHSQYQVGHRLREKGGLRTDSALSGGQLVTYLNWTFQYSSSRSDVIESKTFRAKPICIWSISIPFHQRHSYPAFEDGNCDQNR
jgi:hypothetical protein